MKSLINIVKNPGKLAGALLIVASAALYFFRFDPAAAKITIFHTNDVHGHILPSGDAGGSAVLSNYLKAQKSPYLLLDAGDVFQGTPEGDLTGGEVPIRIMNELGYDAMTLGNHEFDKGQKQLKKLIEISNFSVLGANVIDKRTKQIVKWLEPYYIKEIYGVKIGILGLVTSAMPYITMPEVRRGLEFETEIDAAKKYMPELKQKCDIVIALTHMGVESDVLLAKNVDGIDAIVGGHTHSFLNKPVIINKTAIVQAGASGKCVGKLTLKIKNKKVERIKYDLIPLSKNKYGENEEIKKLIEILIGGLSKTMETVIGSSSQKLSHTLGALGKNGELPLGNWQADVFRKTTNSAVAFHNIGGIRSDLPEGKITLRHIYELSPFGNTIYTMKLTGAQIKEILENSVSGKFGMLQISGLKFKYDRNKKEGERVVEIIVGSKPISPKKYYSVATNSFIAKGGDGFDTFKKGKDIRDTGIIDRDSQIGWLKKYSPVISKIEDRIVNITK